MVNANVFSDQFSRVTDVSRVTKTSNHNNRDNGSNPSFAEMLERAKNGTPSKSDDTSHPDITVDVPVGYGFISYYNGKAQSTFFCMMDSMADMKA